MRIQAKSFNSHTIWDSDYRSTVMNPSVLPEARPVFIDESQADSQYTGMFTRGVRNLVLAVRILDYADREALQAQLKDWFKPGTRGNLVATFAVDGWDYQLPAIVQSGPVSSGDQFYTVVLQAEATAWRAVTADTDSWEVTGTSETEAITVEGDTETMLSMTLTPTIQAPAGYLYQNLYQLVPVNGTNPGIRPWCITINHAALVSAGKSLASGYDMRVYVGEYETRRWLAGANSASCKIWFVPDLKKGASLTLREAVAGTGTVTWLKFTKNAANRTALSRMDDEGIVAEASEWFHYVSRDLANCRLEIDQRGLYDTTEGAHHIGDTFTYLPAGIRLVYGKSTATDPELDDDDYISTKPLFSLSSSDNTAWVWTASDLFYDPAYPSRPGGWTPSLQAAGDVSDVYWIKRNATSGNAAAGMVIGAWQKNGVWQPANTTAAWSFKDRLRIQTVTITGEKYRSTARWPEKAALQRSDDGVVWTTVFTEATPASASTWTALTNNSSAQSISDTTKVVRVVLKKTFAALADAEANFEMQTCTLAFKTANIPTGTLMGEATNYMLDVTIENTTTGESLALLLPMRINRALVLDGEAFTAKYQLTNAHNAISLDDESRTAWLPLQPGTNTLSITGPDMGTLTVALSWYRRRL